MKKIVSLILVIAVMLLVACAETTEADTQTEYIQDVYNYYEIIVDKETGVNYIVHDCKYEYGITVRLNTDGTPYVSGVNGNE